MNYEKVKKLKNFIEKQNSTISCAFERVSEFL